MKLNRPNNDLAGDCMHMTLSLTGYLNRRPTSILSGSKISAVMGSLLVVVEFRNSLVSIHATLIQT